ncbi:MAG TPA: serine hydrolase, partial [Kofleriaceae bacterium]
MKCLLLVALVACGSATPKSALPTTPAGTQLRWVLDGLAAPTKVDAAAIQIHFAPSFLAKVPAAQIAAIFGSMSKLVVGFQLGEIEAKSPRELVAHVATAHDGFVFSIATDDHGQIAGLLVRPELLNSYDAAIAKLDAGASQTQLLVAELDHGTCRPLHAHHETAELAIGSTLKLYVLIALADRIAEGQLSWNQELAVRDDWKSLPSGITQDDPAGTKLTIKTLAERMISISDNTATDHLLYTVGRDRVEAAMLTAKHSAPARNIPYLSTRELFWLKLGMTAQEVTAYRALDPASRRSFLDGLAGKHP